MSITIPRILVVEDIADWRLTIFGILHDENYDVQVTDSSFNAIEYLESANFNLAILDMRLDETNEDNADGLELARIIRQRWPFIEIIILTGYSTPEYLYRAMARNSDGRRLVSAFIEKRKSEMLLHAVKDCLNNR